MYIGCTTVTLTKREQARNSGHKGLRRGKWLQIEAAVRFWTTTRTYFNYSTILLRVCKSPREAHIYENLNIQLIQPSLNIPFITKFFSRATDGSKRTTPTQHAPTRIKGKRLWHRARHLLSKQNGVTVAKRYQVHTTTHLRSWQLLTDLATKTLRSFMTMQTLRSPKFNEIKLYAMHRQAVNMEEPFRSLAIKKLRSVMKY